MLLTKVLLPKITSLALISIISFILLILTSSATFAQFPRPSSTPTPTLSQSPLTGGGTPSPTLRLSPTQAATTPVAGNALPTVMIFGITILLFSTGWIIWQIKPAKSS